MTRAINFLKPLEGFSAKPYWDYKQWSIGYGYACGYDKNVKPALSVTEAEAEKKLAERLESDKKTINARLNVPVSEGLLIALLSFAYNLGMGNCFKMIDRLNAGEGYGSLAQTWIKYHYAGGVPDEGLKARRQKEINLFL